MRYVFDFVFKQNYGLDYDLRPVDFENLPGDIPFIIYSKKPQTGYLCICRDDFIAENKIRNFEPEVVKKEDVEVFF